MSSGEDVPLFPAPVPEVSLQDQLRAIRVELVAVEARRTELLAARDRLVEAARVLGAPLSVLMGWTGVSRNALVKRMPPINPPRAWWFS